MKIYFSFREIIFFVRLLKRLTLLFPPGQFCVKNNFTLNSVNRETLPRKELNYIWFDSK